MNQTVNQTMNPRHDWWKQSVVYQIYPRSFQDTNGDGIGDLPGITSRLDHLQQLGVDVVWLSPIYASPQDDNGYDISDYRNVAPEFGTMADFDAMLAGMHARGIKLMMDLVVNHSSDEHEWFRQARSSRDNPYHDHYIWRDPKPDGSPPTNWEAAFNGSVWEWNEPTGEYYLHMFSRKQPDLNWENPALRAEVYDVMRFWLDKGVDGFRMDVINMISKPWNADGSLPDAPVVREGFLQPSFPMTCNGPRLLEFLREMREQVLDHYDTITVGEAPLATITQGRELTNPETGALNMLFQFEHMDLDSVGGTVGGKWAFKPLDLRDLKATMTRWQEALAGQGWNSLYLSNHDQPRPVSRFGDDGRYRVESAKMLAIFLHGMQGTPYVYQGEELGMTNLPFASIDDCRDIETLNFYREAVIQRGESPAQTLAAIRRKGRDNARTPMQWTAGPQAGFTGGTPWIGVNPNSVEINAEQAYADPDSVFHHYRRLIELRRRYPVFVHGRYAQLLPEHRQLDVYTRTLGDQVLLVLCNFSAEAQAFNWPAALARDAAELLLGNLGGLLPSGEPAPESLLRPWEARLYLTRVASA
ncbi:MAG TPA: alpha-glucosidase [Burkholderiaceae bacterium]|uniref:Oligo-1,6-glucosidase n=1 Tax=Sphaerotilus microaerophilus TaxID=2914710 RepID=A0ABM7YS09_9BURK|nr:alpha-glucosidase [Sphaerotilus sp. FB-5]HMW23298.1 alpha-glucosidase [Burkholderiaceae bacterium]BDI07377.1 oligo-1,6-glucosidase [Sphaerotilus sp. FB-5]HMX09398.1 alpha-glucosidase [Burkholderiaceae bacterium]HMY98233.1 alpha-glucosidase [Burkholderiaceae bacterium]HNB43006.1 alpha-glucosidase [Burkholderiaceae bacterium]